MTTFDLCLAAFLLAAATWSAIAGFALMDRLLYDRMVARLILSALRETRVPAGAVGRLGRSGVLRPFMQRGAMIRLLLDPEQPEWLRNHVARSLADSLGLRRLVRDAWGRGWPGSRWRRIGAWQVLHRSSAVDLHPALQYALDGSDPVVARAAVAMLGVLGDARAAAMLVDALRAGIREPRVLMMQLERLPARIAVPALLPLLSDAPSELRCSAIALLSHRQIESVDQWMGELATDPDSRVRKAVARAMGQIGTPYALGVAADMLSDGAAYVRAQAVRSLHRIARTRPCSVAALVAPLRNDSDWWVRLAVREVYADLTPLAASRGDGGRPRGRQAAGAAWVQSVRADARGEG